MKKVMFSNVVDIARWWLFNKSTKKDSLRIILERIDRMSAELDRLTASVAAENTVIDSAILLLRQLAALLIAAKDDPVKIAALADEVDAKATELANAVTENTPTNP